MSSAAVAEIPFPSLQFPGRTMISPAELAARCGVSDRTILNLTDTGDLVAADLSAKQAQRRTLRYPIENFYDLLLGRLTGPYTGGVIGRLTPPQRAALAMELFSSLDAQTRRELAANFKQINAQG